MGNNWSTTTLGEFVALQRGHDLPDSERRPGNVPVMGSFGVTGYHDIARAKGPGVTVGRSGASFGVVSYCPIDFWPHNAALYVVDFHGNVPRFAYYFLKNIDFSSFNSGSAQPSLNRNFIHPIKVRVPPIQEQDRIADILGTLDDKIELNRRTNETLEVMAKVLFKSWFVDFDPVREKAVGLQPAGLDEDTAKLFPDSFEDSPLGKIPKGWQVTRWGEVISLEYGKSLRDYGSASGMVPVFGTNGQIGRHTEALCTHAGIVIGRKGAYRGVHFSSVPFFVIDTAFYVKPKKPTELRWAYYEMLGLNLNGMDSGSAIPSTSRDDFYSLPVVQPPYQIQRRFAEAMTPLWDRQESNQRESRALADTRDSLLPKLLSGELQT